MKMTSALLLACGLVAASASAVSAQGPEQPPRGFVSLSGGLQIASRSVGEVGSFQLYEEPGSFTGSRKVGNGGFFDIGGGAHITGKFSAGAAFSRFTKPADVPFTVVVPHPLFTETPRTSSLNVKNLRHRENAVHLQLFYQLLSRGRYDASVVGGPSIFSVKQDSLKAVGATETGSPWTAVNLTGEFRSDSKTAVGGNVGVDFNYRVTGGIGAGVFVRYSGASAKLPSGRVKVGGPQMGFGVRYRF